MARIALVTAASRDIGGATARLAGKRGYQACGTYDGPSEPLPAPDSVRPKTSGASSRRTRRPSVLGANG